MYVCRHGHQGWVALSESLPMYQQSQGRAWMALYSCVCVLRSCHRSSALWAVQCCLCPQPSRAAAPSGPRNTELVFSSVTTLPWGGFTPRTPSASSPGQQQQHLSEVSLVALTLCHCRSSSVSLVLEEIPGLKPAAQHLLLSCSRGESCGARGCAWLLADPWLSVLGCHR